jgi:hypothetical protein
MDMVLVGRLELVVTRVVEKRELDEEDAVL